MKANGFDQVIGLFQETRDYLMDDPSAHSTGSCCREPQTPARRHLQDPHADGVVELTGDHPELRPTLAWLRDNWG